MNAYPALVRSKLEYGRVARDPYLKSDIDKLEKLQRSAARFVTGDCKSAHEGCITEMYEGESIINQPNLFPVETHLFFFDVIAL